MNPEPIVPTSLVKQALARVPALIRGEYDTGLEPWRRWNIGEPHRVQKIDQAHLCDRAFHLLATQPMIGEWIARVSAADLVQVWATQLFLKPPGAGELGAVGWHTDRQYWQFWEGDVFTVWVALDDVGAHTGPVLYVEGSHRWPEIEKHGDAYAQNLEDIEGRLKQAAPTREWRKVPAVLRAGGAAVHCADLLHGSAANEADVPRIGLAINVRTERSRALPGVEDYGYASHLDNPFLCPVIYRRSS